MDIWEEPISKLYTDNTGRFPIRYCSGNKYTPTTYHCDSNTTLLSHFKTKKEKDTISAYNSIMHRLTLRGYKSNLQIIDKEVGAKHNNVIEKYWKITYQLVSPDVHQHNSSERSIQTFKDDFFAILAGINKDLPKYLWYLLLRQAGLTLNNLWQATLNPCISAWAYFNGPFDYNATPIRPIWWNVIIHKKTSTRLSWQFRGKDGFYFGPTLRHYHTLSVISKDKRRRQFSDTIEFWNCYLTQPYLTPEDRIIHTMYILTCAMVDSLAVTCNAQLDTITYLNYLSGQWMDSINLP